MGWGWSSPTVPADVTFNVTGRTMVGDGDGSVVPQDQPTQPSALP